MPRTSHIGTPYTYVTHRKDRHKSHVTHEKRDYPGRETVESNVKHRKWDLMPSMSKIRKPYRYVTHGKDHNIESSYTQGKILHRKGHNRGMPQMCDMALLCERPNRACGGEKRALLPRAQTPSHRK